jgi:hypothetical protein
VPSEADGPIMALRTWLTQFYEPMTSARILPVVDRDD